jgi:hypothetical protein
MNKESQLKNLLHQSFDSHEVGNENDGWDKISKRLSVQNYFKFGTRHVNIYNTSLGVGILSVLFFSFFTNESKTELNITKEVAVSSYTKPIEIIKKENIAQNTYKNKIEPSSYTFAKKSEITPQPLLINEQPNSNNLTAIADNRTEVPVNLTEDESINDPLLEELQSQNLELDQQNAGLLAENKSSSDNQITENSKSYRNIRWAIDLFTVPVFSDAMAINNNLQNETLKQKVAAGLAVKCIYNKYILETGFVYKSQSKNFSQKTYEDSWISVVTIDTVTKYNTNLITGKRYRTKVDTISRTEKKFITIENNVAAVNTYTTMEIPLFIGYRLNYKKFISTSKFGIVTYINKTAVGKMQNIDSKVTELSNFHATSTNCVFSFSNAFCYRVRGPVNVFAEPYLKIAVNNPGFNELSVGAKKITYGMKLGIEIVL